MFQRQPFSLSLSPHPLHPPCYSLHLEHFSSLVWLQALPFNIQLECHQLWDHFSDDVSSNSWTTFPGSMLMAGFDIVSHHEGDKEDDDFAGGTLPVVSGPSLNQWGPGIRAAMNYFTETMDVCLMPPMPQTLQSAFLVPLTIFSKHSKTLGQVLSPLSEPGGPRLGKVR